MWVRGLKQHGFNLAAANRQVAPYVGAWIETFFFSTTASFCESHPMWVRGLKHCHLYRPKRPCVSHPMWVRGLKQTLKSSTHRVSTSHPMWVRGLKQTYCDYNQPLKSRTLCGCVD